MFQNGATEEVTSEEEEEEEMAEVGILCKNTIYKYLLLSLSVCVSLFLHFNKSLTSFRK